MLRQSFTIAVNGVYFARFSKTEKGLTIRRIERENTVLYPGLEIIDYKLPLVIRRPNSLGKTKRTLTVILSIVLTRIYDEILDKRITEGGSIKQVRP